MKGLKLFHRTNCRGVWNIVSFHSPHSLTWSWIISFSRFRSDEARVFPLGRYYRDNNGIQWWFRIPWLGIVQWHRQRPMPFHEIYRRMRDEVDLEKYHASRPPPPTAYESGEGGRSLH